MRFAVWLLVFFLAVVFGGCQSKIATADKRNENSGNLTVSAAASLKDAFAEIGESYRAQTGKTVNFNYGSSGALQKQIETGAPVDVFASASIRQMDELAQKNLVENPSRRDFAGNTLILIIPQDSKLKIAAFSDLIKSDVRKIAVGNPKTVPAGQYAEESLTKMNLQNALQPKLIFAEDVRQVLDYIGRGEADAGIVYGSDAQIAAGKVRVVAVADAASHAPILYPIAIIKESKQQAAAQDFISFVTGAKGQTILRKYGFTGATEK